MEINCVARMSSLQEFINWFWFSLIMSIGLAAWWFIIAHRRESWLRWTEKEAAFWRRVKMPAATIESIKRQEQSRIYPYFIGGLSIIWLLLAMVSAWAYFHFRAEPPFAPSPKSAERQSSHH